MELLVKPFLDNDLHGSFSTRAPARQNQIGISVVRLTKVEENLLYIRDVYIIDGTPLLDIKPYIPEFDARKTEKLGWFEKNLSKLFTAKDDVRFTKCAPQ